METLLTAHATETPEFLPNELAPFPEGLVLDWTDYCNAKCFFCPREEYEKQIGGTGGFIPLETLKKLETVLRKVKYFCISSAIGEPLLHPELEEILEWLYQINPSILLRTVTNGTALTKNKADWFAGHIDWLSVSLNAANGEAHFRDMFPHLLKRGIDAQKRWELHIRHLTEFIVALPAPDRSRVRFQMVTHRYNIKDVTDFVRLVAKMGASQAVITNICVHPTTVDWSLFWVKDQYNDAVEEASEIGTQLGVQVHAARFYTSVKPVLDLDKVCRDPIDVAYISKSFDAAPCCHWAESSLRVDIYNDDQGFERYWNSDVLRRLRKKRNFESCQVCGMSRVFDETSFHFSPKLKKELIAAGRLSEINDINDFSDAALVRTCVDNRLDLSSIRRTLLTLNLPSEMAGRIQENGIAALTDLKQECWRAFQKTKTPITRRIPLAGAFLGIGWGPPIHEPQNRVSARSIGAGQNASIFIRVRPRLPCEIRLTVHHVHPAELVGDIELRIGEIVLPSELSSDENGRKVLTAHVPTELIRENDGRLWLQIGCFAGQSLPVGYISLMSLDLNRENVSDTQAILSQQRTRSAFAREIIEDLSGSERIL